MCTHSRRKITETIADARRRFGADTHGNVALLFGLMSILLFTAMGGGLDFSRAYLARQKLSQVATMACQYASRPAIVDTSVSTYDGSNGAATYVNNVNNFISTTWSTQKVNLTQTVASPFTFAQGGAADVSLASTVPSTFIQIVGINSIPITAQSHCYDTVASIQPRVPDSAGQYVIREGFEAGGTPGGWNGYKPNGQMGTQATPTGYTSAIGYTGSSGTQWHVTGYCFEQDGVGVIKTSVPEGNFSGELDCDDGNFTKGNSAISSLNYLAAGTYELRYFYVSRVGYPNYDPTNLCGTTASDLSWANDTYTKPSDQHPNVSRTNQINVYLDLNPANNQVPLHTTLDGLVQLGGVNLIDTCVYATDWVERSVSITVTTPGYYWLSFAADGKNDSVGGQIDNIRLCRVTCPGSLQDNFPTTWAGNKLLFAETFELPVQSKDAGTLNRTKAGNLALSYGTSGTASSGWPNETASGWATAPYNEVVYWMQATGMTGTSPGTQYISLQGSNSGTSDPLNRSISRKFLLDPGYYNVAYNYTSLNDFSYDFIYGTNCTAAPTSAPYSLTGYGIKGSHNYGDPYTTWWQYRSTNLVNVFMANGQLVSTPSVNSTLGGAPTYTNPDGSTSASPTAPLDNGTNFAAYNAAANNPVIDSCYYSSGFAWVARSVNVKITKPGWYWLAFSSLGDPLTGLGAGPGIENIRLTALSSPYASAPSSPVVTIPAPNPQPGSTIAFTGFTIKADPLTP